MVLTRSIRRKITLLLTLTVFMLVLQAGVALMGLWSYHQTVRELDYGINSACLKDDMLIAVARLYHPLIIVHREKGPPHEIGFSPEERAAEFHRLLNQAQLQIGCFHKRLVAIQEASGPRFENGVIRQVLMVAEKDLKSFEPFVLDLANPQQFQKTAKTLLPIIEKIWTSLEQLPDLQQGLAPRMATAREVYRRSSVWVGSIAVITVLLFAILVHRSWIWVIRPIRQLHADAWKVASGNYHHRAKLQGQDEIVDLAEAFNLMTQRFEETRSSLDQQVQERSRQLLRSERMASMGILATGLAHEINNPLQIIAISAEALESRLSENTEALQSHESRTEFQSYLRRILDQAFRVQEITSRMLSFARGKDGPRVRQNLSQLVGEVLDMVSQFQKYRMHSIEFDRSQQHLLEVNGAEINQVVLNIVTNALESMETPGSLKISIEEFADEVVLAFSDTGCGMSKEVLENLFEPFFTERKNGRGTGLGLSISQRIVSDHGGRIEPFSAGPGTGSTFRVHLPRSTAIRRAA